MTRRSRNLETTLADFALELATAARLSTTTLENKIDTFKALTAYRALELKGRKRHDEEDSGEPTMGDLQRAINGEGHGTSVHRR